MVEPILYRRAKLGFLTEKCVQNRVHNWQY